MTSSYLFPRFMRGRRPVSFWDSETGRPKPPAFPAAPPACYVVSYTILPGRAISPVSFFRSCSARKKRYAVPYLILSVQDPAVGLTRLRDSIKVVGPLETSFSSFFLH